MADLLFCFKKTSPLKLPGQIKWNLTGSFIACLFTKIQQFKASRLTKNNNKIASFHFGSSEHLYKKHLCYYYAKFNETLREASLDEPLQKYKVPIDQQQNGWLTVLLMHI